MMDSKKLLKIRITLIIVVLFCIKIMAKDEISFTWETEGGALSIGTKANEEFMVNWGDGTIETIDTFDTRLTYPLSRISHEYATRREYMVAISGFTDDFRFTYINFNVLNLDYQLNNLILTGCSELQNLYCQYGKLQEIDLSGCPKLTQLGCADNQLIHLDLSGCPKLAHLMCWNNQLQELDLTGCSNLQSLTCYNNRLQLSDLFTAQLLVNDQNGKWFGAQNLHPQTAILGEELFPEQSVFNGICTNYSVIQNGNPAPESDYTVINGKLIFNAVGKYTVTMTNDAIVPTKYHPAKVIVEITVEKGTGIAETKQNNLTVYPNPVTTEVHVKLNSPQTGNYVIYNTAGQTVLRGKLQEGTTINVESLSKGIYYLNLDGKENTTVSFIKN